MTNRLHVSHAMSTSARKAARKAAQTPSSHSTVVSLLNSMQKKNAHSTHKKARSHSTLTNLMNYSNKQWGIVCYTRDEKCVAASEKHKNAATGARADTAPVNNVSSQVLQDGGVLLLVICLRNQPLCTEGGECLQPVLNRSCLSQRGPLNLVRSKMIL